MKRILIVIALSLPAISSLAQEWVERRLKNSPRHQEWIETKAGNRTVHSFITYPEVSKKVPVIIVIMKIKD